MDRTPGRSIRSTATSSPPQPQGDFDEEIYQAGPLAASTARGLACGSVVYCSRMLPGGVVPGAV